MITYHIEQRVMTDSEFQAAYPEMHEKGFRAVTYWKDETHVVMSVNNGAFFVSKNEKGRLLGHENLHVWGYKHEDGGIMALHEPGILNAIWTFFERWLSL